MIAVVQRQPGAPPCVAYLTRRVGLHVGIRTWCEHEVDASAGVYQVPDSMKVCPDCQTALLAFGVRS